MNTVAWNGFNKWRRSIILQITTETNQCSKLHNQGNILFVSAKNEVLVACYKTEQHRLQNYGLDWKIARGKLGQESRKERGIADSHDCETKVTRWSPDLVSGSITVTAVVAAFVVSSAHPSRRLA